MTMFDKLRNKSGKQFVKKYQVPFDVLDFNWQLPQMPNEIIPGVYKSQVTGQLVGQASFGREKGEAPISSTKTNTGLDKVTKGLGAVGSIAQTLMPQTAEEVSGVNEMIERVKAGEFDAKSAVGGVAAAAISGASQVADQMMMGDKNFGAQSEAIDTAVHGVSGALMKSGNPYAMIAGAALEGANFLTKAGGQTVQGFDVDIKSSGYDSNMGHMESSSSRDFGAMIGLGGLFGQGRLKDKLAKRNAQAKMAMNAANIAEEQAFEQEARANSIQNTIMNNNIALSGGLDTSLLGG